MERKSIMRLAVQHRVSTSFYSLEPNVIHSSLLVFARVNVAHLVCAVSSLHRVHATSVRHSSGQTSPRVGVCFGTRRPEPARNATPPARVAYRTSTFISQTQPHKERRKVSFHKNAERDTHCTMHK